MFFKSKKRREALAQVLDPERIYVENVRAYFDVKLEKAEKICAKAESRGFFERWIGYEHPDYRHIVAEHRVGDPLPEEPIHDEQSEMEEDEKQDFYLNELKKITFFKAPIR